MKYLSAFLATSFLIALPLLLGCANTAIPETVALEAGTTIKHEVGESPARVSTVAVKVLWRLR